MIHYESERAVVYHGDCLDVLRELPDASVDAVVTDPPYLLGFMGREWDTKAAHEHTEWHQAWAAECLRALKPGGHMLAFGGTRTWHRLACAIEDAGFEIRDNLAWMYGSGFPKSLDVSKAIDKAAGAEREVIGPNQHSSPGRPPGVMGMAGSNRRPAMEARALAGIDKSPITAPATPDAARWQGWGTGALNVDDCRIPTSESDKAAINAKHAGMAVDEYERRAGSSLNLSTSPIPLKAAEAHALGRWPANVVLDETAAAMLDEQSGTSRSRIGKPRGANPGDGWGMTATGSEYDDLGGASRFFYTAKAGSDERPRVRKSDAAMDTYGTRKRCRKCGRQEVNMPGSMCVCPEPDYAPDPSQQGYVSHPTVKPLELMRWLVRLVTPPGGTVLEPFAGSGATVEACILEGFRCVAIEREADYLPLVLQRIQRRLDPVSHHVSTRSEDDEPSLFDLLAEELAEEGGAA